MKLKFTGKRYVGQISFTGPGEMEVGKDVSQSEADRLVKDFPGWFEIIKEMKPTTDRSMRPKKTK